MNEDTDKSWPDSACTAVTGSIICIPLLLAFGIQWGYLLAIALTAGYYILIKIMGRGSVVEVGVLVLIIAILFSIFGGPLIN